MSFPSISANPDSVRLSRLNIWKGWPTRTRFSRTMSLSSESLAFLRDEDAVFDLRPANVVKTPGGLIIPIDSIPVRLDAASRAIFGK